MSDKPTNYKEWVPRVSSIVEFIYPFHWESKDRFHSWLERNNISLSEYMKEASTWWTYVHLAMETYGKTWKWWWRKYKEIVANWIQFYNDFDVKLLEAEKYVASKDYQWTCDAIALIEWKKWILDWKTYWLAKHKFNVDWAVYRKPYDKLKKAKLQLTLYARLLGITNIAVVELDRDWYHFHPLELVDEKEIKEILMLYKNSYIDEI